MVFDHEDRPETRSTQKLPPLEIFDRIQIACMCQNEPLAAPRGGIFMRFATLAFEAPDGALLMVHNSVVIGFDVSGYRTDAAQHRCLSE